MARPIVIGWLPADTSAIAAAQLVDAGEHFIINGTLAGNVPPNPWVSFIEIRQSRTVSMTAPAVDNSSVNFTISGIYRNAPVSEVLAGPTAADTVYTTQLFDIVTSIVPDIDTPGLVSIGSGTVGNTAWIEYDYDRYISPTSFQVVVSGTINYTLNCTLDDIQTNSNPFVFDSTGSLTNQSTSKFASGGTIPFRYCSIGITDVSSEGPTVFSTGGLVLTFIQQGIR